jgi:glyoxalase family protein
MVGVTSLSIPIDAVGFWAERFRAHSVPYEPPFVRGEEEVIAFRTPDGLPLELVGSGEHKPGKPWTDMPVDAEHAISGMRGIRIYANDPGPTEAVLTGVMGLEQVDAPLGNAGETTSPDRTRFRAQDGSLVDIEVRSGGPRGVGGHGTAHHIAFRAEDDAAELQLLDSIQKAGLHASPVMDRNYFHSIYFREPGHVLFEIATDPPGFTVDEPFESLGSSLKLPAQYEPYREQIVAALPPLRIPHR